jgi:tryptophan 2,3-dioxygenase
MTDHEPLTYGSYVRLDALLAIQRPLTLPDIPVVWAAERFFIVCHQASELWQSQVLVDLEHAAARADDGDWAAVRVSLSRVASIALLLSAHLEQFYHLPREHFLRFRLALAGVSGAESKQFRELLRGGEQRQVRHLRLRLSEELGRRTPTVNDARDDDACVSARTLEAFLETVTAWRRLHMNVADHLIQDLDGTGGTAGVAYLRRRLADGCGEADRAGRPPVSSSARPER